MLSWCVCSPGFPVTPRSQERLDRFSLRALQGTSLRHPDLGLRPLGCERVSSCGLTPWSVVLGYGGPFPSSHTLGSPSTIP